MHQRLLCLVVMHGRSLCLAAMHQWWLCLAMHQQWLCSATMHWGWLPLPTMHWWLLCSTVIHWCLKHPEKQRHCIEMTRRSDVTWQCKEEVNWNVLLLEVLPCLQHFPLHHQTHWLNQAHLQRILLHPVIYWGQPLIMWFILGRWEEIFEENWGWFRGPNDD